MTSVSVLLPGAADEGSPPARQPRDRRFVLALAALAALAFAIRLGYVLGWHDPHPVGGDAFYYHHGANLLADGRGFPHPYWLLDDGFETPGAQHPPGYLVALAAGSVLGFRSPLEHQVLSCLLGTATVVVIGMLARRLAGVAAGLTAAALAAVYPHLWMNDALLMSETLVQLTCALTLYVAYVFWSRRSWGSAALLGAAVGVTTLARAETAALTVLLVVPLCLWTKGRAGERARGEPFRRRLALGLTAAAAFFATLAPWVGYNLARFEEPVLLSTGLDPTLVVTNCEETYSGDFYAYWWYGCLGPRPPGDDSEGALVYRERALDFIREHKAEVPGVVVARVARSWGLYRPGQSVVLDTIETREMPASRVGLVMFYSLAIASVPGALVLRRRGLPVTPLVAVMATSVLAAAIAGGLTRYRAAAEVSLVVLAAVAFAALPGVLAARRRRPRASGSATGSATGAARP